MINVGVLIGLSVLSTAVIIGIFLTKTPGFGRYTSSLLILVLVLFITSVFRILGEIEPQIYVNVIFAIVGYAGGLITGKIEDGEKRETKQ